MSSPYAHTLQASHLKLSTRGLTSISGEFGCINIKASMKNIPQTENSLELRTDFSHNSSWESICAAIQKPLAEFRAYEDSLSAPADDGLPSEQLPTLMPPG